MITKRLIRKYSIQIQCIKLCYEIIRLSKIVGIFKYNSEVKKDLKGLERHLNKIINNHEGCPLASEVGDIIANENTVRLLNEKLAELEKHLPSLQQKIKDQWGGL